MMPANVPATELDPFSTMPAPARSRKEWEDLGNNPDELQEIVTERFGQNWPDHIMGVVADLSQGAARSLPVRHARSKPALLVHSFAFRSNSHLPILMFIMNTASSKSPHSHTGRAQRPHNPNRRRRTRHDAASRSGRCHGIRRRRDAGVHVRARELSHRLRPPAAPVGEAPAGARAGRR